MKLYGAWILGIVTVILFFAGVARLCEMSADKNEREREAQNMVWSKDGWEAGREGSPPDVCPHGFDTEGRKHWMKGYRKGRLERLEQPSGAEKAPERSER